MKTLFILCLIFIIACKHPIGKTETTFIVPNNVMLLSKKVGNQPPPPPPPKEYYFPSNFIIDTGGHIYYYQQRFKFGWICGSNLKLDLPPYFINLQPKDIIEVPTQNVEEFIKCNIQHLDNSDRIFAIASVMDTITSLGLKKIFSVFEDKSNDIHWVFRRTTQEENIVLNFKKSKKMYYDAEEIKWDSTKTLFPPEMPIFKFTPPKIEE